MNDDDTRSRAFHPTAALLAVALVIGVVLAPGVAEAITIKVGSMSVNGLKVKNLRCTLQSGGFLAAAKVVGALAKKRKALKACAHKKTARPRVSWRFNSARVTHVRVRGSRPKVNACVKRVMRGVRMGLRGSCTATLLLP